MGEIAVLSLKARIKEVYREYQKTTEGKKKNKEKTLTILFGMLAQLAKGGNNQAIEFLIDCLWDDGLAKWCIKKFAPLFSGEKIIKIMREYPMKKCRDVEELSWVWEPFKAQEPEGSCLPQIAGRVAYLLSKVEIELDKDEKLDSRLIVPLCAIHLLEKETKLNANKKYIQYPLGKPTSFFSGSTKIDDALKFVVPSKKWENLFKELKFNCQYELLLRLALGKRIPDKNDWGNNIIQSDDYKFKTGWHYRWICYLAQTVSLSSFAVMLLSLFILGMNHPLMILGMVAASVMLFSSWYLFWREPLHLEDENALTYFIFIPLHPIFLVLSLVTSRMMATVALVSRIFTSTDTDNDFFKPETIKIILDWTPLIAWFIIISIFICLFLLNFFEWISVAILLMIFWISFFGIMHWLWKTGLKREYEAQNPLSGIFQEDSKCQSSKSKQT
jgi:hypothetical protein